MEEGAEGSQEGQAGANRPRLIAAAPFAIVAVVGLLLTRAFWFPGSYVVNFDSYAYSGPNLEVTERAVRAWRLPVINEWIFGGVPHLGNPSAAALYPVQLLTLGFETNRAMGLLVAGHVVLLGVGMLLLARRLGLGSFGATAAALISMAAGSTLTKSVQFEQILVVAWIPLLLAAVHAVLFSARPWRAASALAATTAAILLAGHPQLVYETAVLAVAVTVGLSIDDGRWRRLGHVAAGAVLGVCIALPQLVAVLAATTDSVISSGRDPNRLLSPALSLDPASTAKALLGTIQDRDPAAFAGGFESIAFVGVAVALVAVIGLVHAIVERRSRPWAISLAATAALALVWSYGPRSFVFRAAFDVLPGFDLARASARWLVVVVLVGALFAGVGFDVLHRRASRRDLVVAVTATTLLIVLLLVGAFDAADRRSAAIWFTTAVVVVAALAVSVSVSRPGWIRAGVVAIAVVAVAELGVMSLHSLPEALQTDTAFTDHRTATTEFLEASDGGFVVALTDDGRTAEYQVPGLRPNANVLAPIRSIDGYDGGVQVTDRWADALRRLTPAPDEELPLRNSLSIPIRPEPLARLGVRYILLDRDRPADEFIPGWTGPLASDDEFDVWGNPAWIGDAIAWPAAIATDDPAELLREAPSSAVGAAVVDESADAFGCVGAPTECTPVTLPTTRPRPERIEVDADVDGPSLVSVTQQALPGWNVEVDGNDADVVVVDGLFLGVRVPAGEHTVTFRYESPWLRLSLAVSIVASAATIALALGGTIRRRGQTTQAAGGGDR